ncbi:MAG: hypothetical protein Q9211_000349 [Gyalolechia sp. 1 TL-2023]
MVNNQQSYTLNTHDAAEEVSKGRLLSFDEMECMLQNAEKRLAGQVSPRMDAIVCDTRTRRTSIPTLPKLDNIMEAEPYLNINSKVARVDSAKSINNNERRLANQRPPVAAESRAHKLDAKGSKPNAGADWFHMPRTTLTSDLRRDLQLLKMRSTWDPKRHYKSDNRRPLIPEYAQVGTIMEGPTDYYSSRISKRDRKMSFVEGVLAAERSSGRFKSTYADIQSSKTSGRRAFYDRLKGKRSKRYLNP